MTVTEEGDTYVRVGDAKDKDDIGEIDKTDVVIKGGKDPNKPAETNSDGSADEVEKQKPVVDAEPGEPAENTGTELIVWPEDAKSGEARKRTTRSLKKESRRHRTRRSPKGRPTPPPSRHRLSRSLSRRPQRTKMTTRTS